MKTVHPDMKSVTRHVLTSPNVQTEHVSAYKDLQVREVELVWFKFICIVRIDPYVSKFPSKSRNSKPGCENLFFGKEKIISNLHCSYSFNWPTILPASVNNGSDYLFNFISADGSQCLPEFGCSTNQHCLLNATYCDTGNRECLCWDQTLPGQGTYSETCLER